MLDHPGQVHKSTDGGVTWTDGARGAVATATQPAAGGPTGAIPPAADTAEALHRKLARHEERMDQLSQTLQRTLPMDQRGEVVAQQRHWRARRDIACNLFDRSQYPDRWLRAIREDYTKLICLLQVTRTRLGELERAATAGTVPASVPELAARTILGDTRSYAIREAVGSSSTHGKWYYEAGVHRGAVARVAETALALGFVGYRNFGGHLLDIRSGDADRGILWLGFALDADTGKVYTSINGAWIRGAPGSAEGMDVEAPSAYSAIVAADVPINQLLSPDVIDVNLGERPFVSQMPDRYRPVRVRQ